MGGRMPEACGGTGRGREVQQRGCSTGVEWVGIAKELGKDAAEALAQNSAVMPYKIAAKFTAGHKGAYQAHHIIEQQWVGKYIKGNVDKMPAVILDRATHERLTAELAAETPRIRDITTLWAAYQKVYRGHPHWLTAIAPYFK